MNTVGQKMKEDLALQLFNQLMDEWTHGLQYISDFFKRLGFSKNQIQSIRL